MTEPPPWPPASIAKMMNGGGERRTSMMETLAGQLATEPRSGLAGPELALANPSH